MVELINQVISDNLLISHDVAHGINFFSMNGDCDVLSSAVLDLLLIVLFLLHWISFHWKILIIFL